MPRPVVGHLAALATILIWGSTFVVTKVLLSSLGPTQVLVVRFAAAGFVLVPFAPGFFRWAGWHTERRWLAAGVTGVTAYYLGENGALTLASATDVGLLVSTIPLWTLLASRFGTHRQRWSPAVVLGSVVAFAGVLVVLGKGAGPTPPLVGGLLALGAALAFTLYSRIIDQLPPGTPPLVTVARSFLWGTLAALPFLVPEGGLPAPDVLARPEVGLPLAFLAVVASGLAYASWNHALAVLGPVRTNTYIYTVPVVNTALGAWVLGEPVTAATLVGCALVIGGVMGAGWGARVP